MPRRPAAVAGGGRGRGARKPPPAAAVAFPVSCRRAAGAAPLRIPRFPDLRNSIHARPLERRLGLTGRFARCPPRRRGLDAAAARAAGQPRSPAAYRCEAAASRHPAPGRELGRPGERSRRRRFPPSLCASPCASNPTGRAAATRAAAPCRPCRAASRFGPSARARRSFRSLRRRTGPHPQHRRPARRRRRRRPDRGPQRGSGRATQRGSFRQSRRASRRR